MNTPATFSDRISLRRKRRLTIGAGLFSLMLAATAAPDPSVMLNKARNLWKQAERLRAAGKFDQAAGQYEKAAEHYAEGNARRFVQAANQMMELCRGLPTLSGPPRDGAFTGGAPGYAGNVSVEIRIARGRIEEVRLAENRETRPLTALDALPKTIVKKQTPSVDGVSGATITSCAIQSAVFHALQSAVSN